MGSYQMNIVVRARGWRRSAAVRNVLYGALLLWSAGAHAGEHDTIMTDRPDFVESSNVVGDRAVQVETSVSLDRHDADGVRARVMSTPTLLRIGIGDAFELRVETDGRMVVRSEAISGGPSNTERGYADTAIGIKWHAMDSKGALPSIGFLAHLDLDSGSDVFRGNGVRPSLRMVAEWELPGELSLGVMPGLVRSRGTDGKTYTAGIFGIVLGKSWTEQCRTFIEIAAPQLASAAHGGNVATFDIGVAYLLSRQWQVDTALARGLTRNTTDLSWTVGLSAKF